MRTIFARPGTDKQFIDMREIPVCPDGMIGMLSERPAEGEWIARRDGSWERSNPCLKRCNELDAFASEVRQRFISGGGDVIAEYQRAETAAKKYRISDYQGEVPSPVQSHATHYQVSAREAADTILAMADIMNDALDRIRDVRLGGKKALQELGEEASDAEFEAVYSHWHTLLDDIKPPGNGF